jgi:TRAP-type mannitol/chloroaromatic compound transport system permease small subunit
VGYVFLRNAHVRIDFIASRLSKRTNAVIDAIGIVVFVVPLSIIMINLSWPLFMNAYVSGEVSSNAGGLIRWPVMLLIPAGFGLLLLQSLSELIKRIAFLKGLRAEPFSVDPEAKSDDVMLVEELAEQIERERAAGIRQ